MKRVAAGEVGETIRLHRPARELAFSKHDRASAGFGRAVEAAVEAGFEPVIRLAGGRAAAFHEQSLALAWAVPTKRPVAGTRERFERLSGVIVRALRGLGVDARVGEVEGEYCPGAWSVNARGQIKLAGIGQRMIAGAAHCGAVVVVGDSALMLRALVPVYQALELELDPATVGAIEDEVAEVDLDRAEAAIVAELAAEFEIEEAEIDPQTLELAARLESEHLT